MLLIAVMALSGCAACHGNGSGLACATHLTYSTHVAHAHLRMDYLCMLMHKPPACFITAYVCRVLLVASRNGQDSRSPSRRLHVAQQYRSDIQVQPRIRHHAKVTLHRAAQHARRTILSAARLATGLVQAALHGCTWWCVSSCCHGNEHMVQLQCYRPALQARTRLLLHFAEPSTRYRCWWMRQRGDAWLLWGGWGPCSGTGRASRWASTFAHACAAREHL